MTKGLLHVSETTNPGHTATPRSLRTDHPHFHAGISLGIKHSPKENVGMRHMGVCLTMF